jgi:hypothetical protein
VGRRPSGTTRATSVQACEEGATALPERIATSECRLWRGVLPSGSDLCRLAVVGEAPVGAAREPKEQSSTKTASNSKQKSPQGATSGEKHIRAINARSVGGRASVSIIAEGAHARSVGWGASEPLPSSRLRRAVEWQRNSDVSSFKQPCHTSSHMSSQARPLSLHQFFGRGLTDISSSTSAGTRGRGRKGGVGGRRMRRSLLSLCNKPSSFLVHWFGTDVAIRCSRSTRYTHCVWGGGGEECRNNMAPPFQQQHRFHPGTPAAG